MNTMTERQGDKAMDERLSDGEVELSDFFPEESFGTADDIDNPRLRDAYTTIMGSPMRRSIYLGENGWGRRPHQSTRRENAFVDSVKLPDHVVGYRIKIEDKSWTYKTGIESPSQIRRVFIERDQALELDIDQTLLWMSVSKEQRKYAETRAQLEQEINDVNNQVILQHMYNRVEEGKSMLPFGGKALKEVA